MPTWGEFRAARPDLAEPGRALVYRFGGVGLAFIATTGPGGAPRMHPIAPVIAGQGLYAFIVPSPKRSDLVRDGRYAMHSFPLPENEDAFYVAGRALRREDARPVVDAAWLGERGLTEAPGWHREEWLFELMVERALLTRTSGHGDPDPQHSVWTAPA